MTPMQEKLHSISRLQPPGNRAAHSIIKFTEEQAQKRAETKAANAQRMSERMTALHADPEFKAAHAQRMKARHADPAFHARASRAGAQNLERWRRDQGTGK